MRILQTYLKSSHCRHVTTWCARRYHPSENDPLKRSGYRYVGIDVSCKGRVESPAQVSYVVFHVHRHAGK